MQFCNKITPKRIIRVHSHLHNINWHISAQHVQLQVNKGQGHLKFQIFQIVEFEKHYLIN